MSGSDGLQSYPDGLPKNTGPEPGGATVPPDVGHKRGLAIRDLCNDVTPQCVNLAKRVRVLDNELYWELGSDLREMPDRIGIAPGAAGSRISLRDICTDLASHVEEQVANREHPPPSPLSFPPTNFIEILLSLLDKVAESYGPAEPRHGSFSDVVDRITRYGFDSREQVINLLGVCSYDLYYRVLLTWPKDTPVAKSFRNLLCTRYRQARPSQLGLDDETLERLRTRLMVSLGGGDESDSAAWSKEPYHDRELQQLHNKNGLIPHATESGGSGNEPFKYGPSKRKAPRGALGSGPGGKAKSVSEDGTLPKLNVTQGPVANLPAAKGTDKAAAYGDAADAANGFTADGTLGGLCSGVAPVGAPLDPQEPPVEPDAPRSTADREIIDKAALSLVADGKQRLPTRGAPLPTRRRLTRTQARASAQGTRTIQKPASTRQDHFTSELDSDFDLDFDSELEYDGYTSVDSTTGDPVEETEFRLQQVKCPEHATDKRTPQYWHWIEEEGIFEHQVLMSVEGSLSWRVLEYDFSLRMATIKEATYSGRDKRIVIALEKGSNVQGLDSRGTIMALFNRPNTMRRFLAFLRKNGRKVVAVCSTDLRKTWDSLNPPTLALDDDGEGDGEGA
ncbi:hypothetical protein VTG60DRAFT_3330 [Thermothelomyces hinnuleus]